MHCTLGKDNMVAKKPLTIRLEDETYDRVEKCRQKLEKKKHIGGQSLSKCGEFLIKEALDAIEEKHINLR